MIEYVQFFPTLRCDKNCDFCFNKLITSNTDFPEEMLEAFVDILKRNEVYKVDILGGEPFLYDSLTKLVHFAIESDMEVNISTNGSFIEKIESFVNIFRNEKIKIGVSINYDADPEIFNLIKKYRLWIKSIFNRGISEELLKFAKKFGIPYYLLYMDAVTVKDLEQSMPFYEFITFIEELRFLYPNIQPVFCRGFTGSYAKYRCPAGTEKITVMPDGSVYPCYLLAGFEEFCLGNIFEDCINEILNSDKLKIFKTYNAVCTNSSCHLKNDCNGGCVAHSIIHYKTYDKPDPRCKGVI
ncbi:MAG TPA: radical SAM/SPASM domain-containing protein [Thermodesulfovibrio thiophilus]|nr:radical SAM/SPASM domain-containing protein [Thermodesulfovibrio thiophilus]HQA03489.1 radical SAM/SPASM domain-containing protein [Thermodesulfovibrio thiophilus]